MEKSITERDAHKDPTFSDSEFARLLILLIDDEEIRPLFDSSGRTLTRVQVDAGKRATDFWSDVVARKFNDPEETPYAYCPPVSEEEIDSRKPPPVQRSGTLLKDIFVNFRG